MNLSQKIPYQKFDGLVSKNKGVPTQKTLYLDLSGIIYYLSVEGGGGAEILIHFLNFV